MWLDLRAYFDKEDEQTDDNYSAVLEDLGLQSSKTLEEISKLVPVRLRIDAIDEVTTTKTENVSQIVMASVCVYLVHMNYNDLIMRMDEFYLR